MFSSCLPRWKASKENKILKQFLIIIFKSPSLVWFSHLTVMLFHLLNILNCHNSHLPYPPQDTIHCPWEAFLIYSQKCFFCLVFTAVVSVSTIKYIYQVHYIGLLHHHCIFIILEKCQGQHLIFSRYFERRWINNIEVWW